MIRPDRQERDLGQTIPSNFPKSFEIRAITRVINAPALMLEHEPAIATVIITQRSRAPMFRGCQGHSPVRMAKTFPPLELDNAAKPEVIREIGHPPGHDSNLRRRQSSQGRFMEVIEMRVREQHQINRWQMLDAQPRTLDSLQQEQPIREIRVNQHIQ